MVSLNLESITDLILGKSYFSYLGHYIPIRRTRLTSGPFNVDKLLCGNAKIWKGKARER